MATPLLENIVRDARFALRSFRRNASYTTATVAVLALAIGVNTAMFSVMDAVLLRPLPFREPQQLAMLWTEDATRELRQGRTAYWNIEQWRKQTSSFEDIAFFDSASATLTTADGADRISVVRHSANLFSLLGVPLAVGRSFTDEEAREREPVVVISHRYWQTRFGGSGGAMGSTLVIDGVRSRVVGILPPRFDFARLDADVWQPHTAMRDWDTVQRARGAGFWSAIGRLGSRTRLEQAQAEMHAIAARLRDELPSADRSRTIAVMPLALHMTGTGMRLALWLLSGAVFCVLLIACTNAASLSLARSASREREMAVRSALGASGGRLMGQLLVEAGSVATISGLLGLLIASALLRFLVLYGPQDVVRIQDAHLDVRVLGCTILLCALTVVAIGLVPAAALTRRMSGAGIQQGGRSVAGGRSAWRVRGTLVIVQYALAILLLAGAGLLLRSLFLVQNVELGFRPERVLSMQLAATEMADGSRRWAFYYGVLRELRGLPGVESAGIVSDLFVGSAGEPVVTVEGRGTERLPLRVDEASPQLFDAIGARLLEGRLITSADHATSVRVAVINEGMARRLWPGGDAVNRRFKLGAAESTAPWFTVVGVIADMRRQGLEAEPIPQMFEALAQNPPRLATLLVRTSVEDPLALAGAVETAVRRVAKDVPVYGVTTLQRRLDRYLSGRRFQTFLLTGFSALALLLAAVGIYGLVQYSVAARTREIGIRLAVGATAGEIFRMVAGEGLRLSIAGLAAGLAGALWLGRVGASLLYGVSPADLLTLGGVSLLLLLVAMLGCFIPARRAMRVEPVIALRQE